VTEIERDGVRLACSELGGSGPPVLLLHGLAGYAGEWSRTAEWLGDRHRVVAFDARGHGASERRPRDLSRDAHLADAAYVIEHLELGPCTVIGQSLGGVTALLLAAARPELVRALVVAEAMPVTPGPEDIEEVERSLVRWAEDLERRGYGEWPRFDPEVMTRTLREAESGEYWQEWERVRCPVLVVRGGKGTLTAAAARRMVESLPGTRLVEIPEAGHDVHLERLAEWQQAVEQFLAGLS